MKKVLIALLLLLVTSHAFCQQKTVNVPMSERPRVAVSSFEDGSLKREHWWGHEWKIGEGIADMLTTYMVQLSRFRMVERNTLNKVLDEQKLGGSALVDTKSAAKIGGLLGADFIIVGKVTEFAWDKQDSGAVGNLFGGALGGLAASKTSARVAVDLRIINTSTGEIVAGYAGKGSESKTSVAIAQSDVGAFAIGSSNFMESILGQATRKAIINWTDQLLKAIDTKKITVLPGGAKASGVVVDVDQSSKVLISNTGTAKGYAVGDKVEICRKGKEIKDPETGEVIKVVMEILATGKVTCVEEKSADISYTLTCGKNIANGDIVRQKAN